MTEPVDPESGVVPERRPRVKLEELPRGQGWLVGFVCGVLVFVGLGALILGGAEAVGYTTEPVSQAVWSAQQQDAVSDIIDQSYDEYVAEFDHENAVGGTIIMAIGAPLAFFLAALLWYTSVGEVTKCPKGHVVAKSHSYCSQCASPVYSKNELSPDDWNKRYGAGPAAPGEASGGVH